MLVPSQEGEEGQGPGWVEEERERQVASDHGAGVKPRLVFAVSPTGSNITTCRPLGLEKWDQFGRSRDSGLHL